MLVSEYHLLSQRVSCNLLRKENEKTNNVQKERAGEEEAKFSVQRNKVKYE